MKKDFNSRYVSGDLPWDIQRPDYNLINMVQEYHISGGTALDVGCGTGDNVLWMANNGFIPTGIDLSREAIKMARKRGKEKGTLIHFHTLDFLKSRVPGAPFDFVFDRGCFHSFDTAEERQMFVKHVHRALDNNGLWLSLAGNYDDGRLEQGPPKRTARDITRAVEPYFEIISMKQGRFATNDPIPSKIWITLMKKRNEILPLN